MSNQPAAKDDPLRGKKSGKWTKYGGAISGLVKERIVDKWYCQTCGKEMPAELKPFLYERCEGDFYVSVHLVPTSYTKKRLKLKHSSESSE